jgi:Zn-dependent protease
LIIQILGLADSDTKVFFVLFASVVFALLVGIGFHEACHAYMATALGDRLPASQGRVTLNPLAHLDPAGTMMMLVIGFGWGKPVQFNPFGLKVRPKTAMLLVSLAGPLSNFVMAGLLAVPIKQGWVPFINPFDVIDSRFFRATVTTRDDYIGLFLTGAVTLNCILGVFNLIPIHPLDGFKVAVGLLPDGLSEEFAKLAQYGPGILMLVILAPFIIGYSPLSEIMFPTVQWLVNLFTGT